MKKIRLSGSRKEESQKYYIKNKERILKQTKEYSLKNPHVRKKAYEKSFSKLKSNLPYYIWKHLKNRSKLRNIEFDLDFSDIIVPEICPVLGIPLFLGTKNQHDNSPSVDRLDPLKGYVKGNINIISEKANRIKSNASAEEIRKVADWLDKIVNGY